MRTPIWEIFVDGTAKEIQWNDHAPNKRFAVHNAGSAPQADDLVWDKETGLIWPRDANLNGSAVGWLDANTIARELRLGRRAGWRLPSVEELATLVDTSRSDPALPNGHPFLSVQFGPSAPGYWTSTNHENPDQSAWFVNFSSGAAGLGSKGGPAPTSGFVWPVRGGRGGVSWDA